MVSWLHTLPNLGGQADTPLFLLRTISFAKHLDNAQFSGHPSPSIGFSTGGLWRLCAQRAASSGAGRVFVVAAEQNSGPLYAEGQDGRVIRGRFLAQQLLFLWLI